MLKLEQETKICPASGIQEDKSDEKVDPEVPHLFLISRSQVADLSELWCADASDSDHNVSIWNFSVTVIICVKEIVQYITNRLSLHCKQ